MATSAAIAAQPVPSPFSLEQESLYQAWREAKLTDYPTRLEQLVVAVDDPRFFTAGERDALLRRLRKANMAIYIGSTGSDPDRAIPHAVASQLGVSQLDINWLADDDGLTSLTVVADGRRSQFIPYSDRAINWHTDGYYNDAGSQIRTLNLHCVSPAADGGENRLMDHEIAYLLLRDENPDYIGALMAPDAMTIPARIDRGGTVARPEQRGPVFGIDPASGDLHMRYTIRQNNVLWKDSALTREAVLYLEHLLESDTPYVYRGLLEPGMGLISNNVLHDRAAFRDAAFRKRLLYRARYYDRIAGTGVHEAYPQLLA